MSTGLALGCEITRLTRFSTAKLFLSRPAQELIRFAALSARAAAARVTTDGGEEKYICLHEIHGRGRGQAGARPWTESTLVRLQPLRRAADGNCDRAGLRSAHEVIDFLTKLRSTLQFLGVRTARCRKAPSAPT